MGASCVKRNEKKTINYWISINSSIRCNIYVLSDLEYGHAFNDLNLIWAVEYMVLHSLC